MGYDISDYREIHAPYGTVRDVERLIEGCHGRGMKFVMDLVVNHSSDQVCTSERRKKGDMGWKEEGKLRGNSMSGSRNQRKGRIIRIGIIICGGNQSMILKGRGTLLIIGVRCGEVSSRVEVAKTRS